MVFTKGEISWQERIPLSLKDSFKFLPLEVLEQQHLRIYNNAIVIGFNVRLRSWTLGMAYLISPYTRVNTKMGLEVFPKPLKSLLVAQRLISSAVFVPPTHSTHWHIDFHP